MDYGKRLKTPNYRKKYWLPNMILFYSLKLLPPRDKSLWIFGSWEGNKYDDNSRYLFEYVRKMHSNIRPVWLTNKSEIVRELRKKGYESYISDSKEGRNIQLKAGAVFYTNGIDDFGHRCYFYGAKVVSLWHGFGIKDIYFSGLKKDIRYWKNRLQNKIFSWVYRDITISSSKVCSEYFSKSFCLKNEKICITGFPRNDVFKRHVKPSDVFQVKAADEYKYILYMPTYRNYGNSAIENTVTQIIEDKTFIAELVKRKVIFLVKKHYLTELKWQQLPSVIKIIDDKKISSTQELLAAADLLITDYSSCILDYVLSMKPAVLYAPDIGEYCKKVGIIDRWNKVYARYSLNSYSDLKNTILACLSGKKSIADKTTEYLRRICEDDEIKETNYCENVYRLVYGSLFGNEPLDNKRHRKNYSRKGMR